MLSYAFWTQVLITLERFVKLTKCLEETKREKDIGVAFTPDLS